MITEKILVCYPALVKFLTGLPAESFWELIKRVEARFTEYEQQRHMRSGRHRAVGAGRRFDQPLVLRVVMLLSYLRLHVPQGLIALFFGATQTDVSRDLRRLLPLLKSLLPVPEVWEVVGEEKPLPTTKILPLAQWAAGRVLVDATEQVVYRSQDSQVRKQYYSGKKKAFTIKTQLVCDGEHHIVAISTAVPGTMHDKKLSDAVHTLERLPDGCEVDADKGYQGLANPVSQVTVRNVETGVEESVPRLTVQIPVRKPKGKELTEEQQAFNRQLASIRVRIEHTIGWIKNWAILATRFRCAHTIYTSVIQVVGGLVNGQTQRWQATRAAAS